MNALSFEWDPQKASSNLLKHKVAFEEAKTVFYDENALVIDDPEHSALEDRFIIMGQSNTPQMLVVVHCYRRKNAVIRIISARKAGTKEQKPYWNT